jgi:hypothetical protein
MKNINRGSMIAGVGLILLGALFIVFNLLPNIGFKETWPMILIVAGFGFCLPALAWSESKKGLSALFIPGVILFVLGGIFLFTTLVHGVRGTWSVAWILIITSVGLGMMLAAKVGEWDHTVFMVGAWIALVSLVLFAVLAAIFGAGVVKYVGAGLLLLLGLYLLINSFFKKKAAA